MTTFKTNLLLGLFCISFSTILISQENKTSESKSTLEAEIRTMDDLLFNQAFNQCKLDLFLKLMPEDLEFYDDRSGLNTSLDIEIASFKDRCSKPHSVTRKLVSDSVHVLGDFGAVQLGVHDFYVDEQKVETSKFITVWERKDQTWMVKRVVSYDHQSVQ